MLGYVVDVACDDALCAVLFGLAECLFELLFVGFWCGWGFGDGDVECFGLGVEEFGGDHVEVALGLVLHHGEEGLDGVSLLLGFV